MKKSNNFVIIIFVIFACCIATIVCNQIYLQNHLKKKLASYFKVAAEINNQNLHKVLEKSNKNLEIYKEILAKVYEDKSCVNNLNISKVEPVTKVEYTHKYIVAQMYQMLKDVHDLFEKNNIEYWANAGTLLGAVRHKGLIPWDDDVDISVYEQDVSRIKELESQLKDLGYELISGPWQKIQPITGLIESTSPSWNKKVKYPAIDIFPSKIEKGEYIHASSIALNAFPKEKASIDSVKNKRLVNFGNFKIWITSDAENELKYLYGEEALTHAVWQGTHQNSRPPYKWQLEAIDKLPAEPFNLTEDRVK